MPAGLDGNPNPIQTAQRDAVLCAVADSGTRGWSVD